MRFPVVPVHTFEDATLNFEALQKTLTNPGAALPFLQLASAQQLALAFGTGSLTYTASDTSAVQTITHGLGRTPKAVLATSTAFLQYFVVTAPSTTTFQIQGQVKAAGTGTGTFYWLAIG